MTLEFLGPLAPLGVDLILVLATAAIFAADLVLPPGDKRVLGWATAGGLALALVATFRFDLNGASLGGAYVGDGLSVAFKAIFLGAGFLAVLGSQHQPCVSPAEFGPSASLC